MFPLTLYLLAKNDFLRLWNFQTIRDIHFSLRASTKIFVIALSKSRAHCRILNYIRSNLSENYLDNKLAFGAKAKFAKSFKISFPIMQESSQIFGFRAILYRLQILKKQRISWCNSYYKWILACFVLQICIIDSYINENFIVYIPRWSKDSSKIN